MEVLQPSFIGGLAAILVHVLLHSRTCLGGDINNSCAPSSCGDIRNISGPFRLISDPENCGDRRYTLSCENNLTVIYLLSGKYYVQEINYTLYTIRLVDAGLHEDSCSSTPFYTLTDDDLGIRSSVYSNQYRRLERSESLFGWTTNLDVTTVKLTKPIIYLRCANPVSSNLYLPASPCINATNTTKSSVLGHSYVLIGSFSAAELRTSCQIEKMSFIAAKVAEDQNMSYTEIHNQLVHGFDLSWLQIRETQNVLSCFLDDSNQVQCVSYCYYFLGTALNDASCYKGLIERIFYTIMVFILVYYRLLLVVIGLCIATRFFFGTLFTTVFVIYKWRRRHLSVYDTIEDFLQSDNNLTPIRYSYSDIKKMARGFDNRLGKGGYGSVYKGKLRSGRFVAIKMLEKSNTNGQDFINEVSTIGRIHHVNVVRLIGFCAEGSKRALVYEFMPNGSLDKYIFSREGNDILSYEKMFEISLGVAHGIEYLHQGCNMQILHFDIKPHNILLDENFTPKVSDFGLAKLYPVDNSIVCLTAVRGTIGYMAPELFYKNIGNVSYKADVYSFGMLLMEIIGKRKGNNSTAEHSSEMYFPDWVYDQVIKENDVGLEISMEKEMELVKKMIIVALWCIQMRPNDRPSMSKVIEMLEGEVERLQLPPKPFLFPQDTGAEDTKGTTNSAWSSVLSGDSL